MSAERLDKHLRLPGVFALSVGPMLASGIFLLPAMVFHLSGPSAILAYLVAGILLIPALLSKAELATAMPRAGGTYYFLDRSMGPMVGTVAGLGTWLALVFKSAFALIGLGAYLVLFVALPIKPVAVVLVLLFAGLSVTGMRNVGRLQIVFVAAVLLLITYFLIRGLPHVQAERFTPFFTGSAPSFLASVGIIYVAFTGLTKVASVAEEIEDLERTIPLAMVYAISLATLVYFLTMTTLVGTLTPEALENTLTPVADGALRILGVAGQRLVAVAAMLAFFSAANAGVTAASRYPLAMARDNIAPHAFKRLGRFRTPVNAIMLTAAVMILFILLLSPLGIAKLASAFQLMIFGLVNLAVVIMRESGIEAYDPGFKAEPYPWVQIVGIITPMILIPQLGLLPLLASAAIICLGIVWYAVYARDRVQRRGALFHVFERMGRAATPQLDRELRQILREKGLRKEDAFEDSIIRAGILHALEEETFDGILKQAASLLAGRLGVAVDAVLDPLSQAARLGETPIGHHIALPHARLQEAQAHELVIVHAPHGMDVEGAQEPVYALFILISPKADPRQHLRFLAELANRAEGMDFAGAWRDLREDEEIRSRFIRHAEVMELIVTNEALVGQTLRDIQLHEDCIVALVTRGEGMIVPHGDTALWMGDVLTIIGQEEALALMRDYFGSFGR